MEDEGECSTRRFKRLCPDQAGDSGGEASQSQQVEPDSARQELETYYNLFLNILREISISHLEVNDLEVRAGIAFFKNIYLSGMSCVSTQTISKP